MKTVATADICIIGSGITASLVARHFVAAGQTVVMLERTNETYFPESSEQYWKEHTVEDVNNPGFYRNYFGAAEKYFSDLVSVENSATEMPFNYNMKYGIGGSGAVWGGLSWRFTEDDFHTKSRFGYGRDWPVSLTDLEPYYAKIEQLYGTSGPEQSEDWPWSNHYPYPAFKQSYLEEVIGEALAPEFTVRPNANSVKNVSAREGGCIGSKTCNYKCPQNAKYRPDVVILPKLLQSSNFQLLAGYPCMYIETDPKSRKISHVVTRHNEALGKVSAKLYYLCANTIENLRILLNSADITGAQIANSNGLLGKYFASHGAVQASIETKKKLYPRRGRPITSVATDRLFNYQREKVNSQLLEVWNMDWGSTYKGCWNPDETLKHYMHSGLSGFELFDRLEREEYTTTMNMIYEIEMQKSNRVTLSDKRDKLGLPVAKVNFVPGQRERDTISDIYTTYEKMNGKPGVTRVKALGNGLNGNHPMGGYCSGDDSKTSVVSRYLRSHDHDNLYIMGGGSFNSTSALNPTHTISALTLFSLTDPSLAY